MNIKKYNGSKPMNKRVVESLLTEEQDGVEKLSLQSSTNALIKQIWDMVDAINGSLILSQEINNVEFEDVLNNILTDCYTNIGQLEKFVQNVSPEAEAIDDGKEGTDEEIPDVEVEPSGIELPEDDTPSDLLDDNL